MNDQTHFHPIRQQLQRAGIPQSFMLCPSIHIDEIRSVAGDSIPGHGNSKLTVHLADAGPERYAHRSLHLCPHTAVPCGLPGRDEPARQEVSVALGDKDRDWDFIQRHVELIFDTKRIQMADAARDKVHALAEDLWRFRRVIQKPGGNDFSKSVPWSHPVDAIIYGSWCLGASYAMIAMCATLGITGRELALRGHSTSEVHLNGQWHFVESIQRFPENGGNNLPGAPFAEIRLNPFDTAYGFCEEQQEFYWETCSLQFTSPANGLWMQGGDSTFLTPQNALALYPGWTDPRFKSPDPHRHPLVWGRDGSAALPELLLKKGQAMQRRFWVGSLAETRALEARFSGFAWSGIASSQVPADGGDWWIAVNGKRYPIRDQGGWTFTKDRAVAPGDWYHTFELPLEALREGDWNTLTIGCDGHGHEFLWFAGRGETTRPEEPCFCPDLDA